MLDVGDQPLSTPEADLLAVAPAAEQMAKRLASAALPFTLGVYGPWGEGKTTFARLVAHYLANQDGWQDRRFVEFSAWPYVTADAVWRALLETVALKVYEVPAVRDGEAGAGRPDSLRRRLRRLMLSEIFSETREPTPAEAQEHAFEQLMAKLGKATALTNRASRDAETVRQVSLLAGLVLDIASAASPPMGPLRRLLGIGSDSFGTPGLDPIGADRSVATVEEVGRSVSELFQKASSPRTVVLIGDLDRCLPEVAFDVLETIKVFLSASVDTKAECLFIVAVDQAVLNHGLRVRLGGDDISDRIDARMYLEKVIQLGISVSAVRDSRPDRLIAAHFPEWCGATDLINIATSGNPRRLRQQCDLLSYGYSHAQERL